MKKPLSGVLLASDLDATLIASDYAIPKRNLEAIERFKEKGGRFTIASGRGMETARTFVDDVQPNAPCILTNGGVIYDFQNGRIVWEQCLPEQSRLTAGAVMEAFDSVGVEAFCGREIYVLRENERVRLKIERENLKVAHTTLADVPLERCHKFLFSDHPARIEEIKDFTTRLSHDKIYFVQSSSFYLELLCAGVNKGTGLRHLADALGIEHRHTFAIGDYDNDSEMLEMAGVSACPHNAPETLKQKADVVVGHCDDGAVADFIEYIERMYSA